MHSTGQALPQLQHSYLPDAEIFFLPEKILQFGAGVLLRGLPDYFIDKANRKGIFNGRIVVVKTTDSGDSSSFTRQEGLYTLCIRGIENGRKVEENILCSAISRVLTAKDNWKEILKCAFNVDLQIIISNTTEIGIRLVNDDIRSEPPVSFPGKLLAFLFERYRAFAGAPDKGFIIIPTELIPENGAVLKNIILQLAHQNKLDGNFIQWLTESNRFCDSLVDRIVPGTPGPAEKSSIEQQLGYKDELMIVAEVYRLWAIRGDEQTATKLSFARADNGVIISPEIDIYRELKLRMLNGTHTLSSGLALLSGFITVKEAMDDPEMLSFIRSLMLTEIANAIPLLIPQEKIQEYGNSVLERFLNPYIEHKWRNITLQYTSKMKMRILPVLLRYFQLYNENPSRIVLGFAAYLVYMKVIKKEGEVYYGCFKSEYYQIQDEQASWFYRHWEGIDSGSIIETILKDTSFWQTDFSELPGFVQSVIEQFHLIEKQGVKKQISALVIK